MVACSRVLGCLDPGNKEVQAQLRAIMTPSTIDPDAVCQIEVLQQAFDWLQPPNRNAYRPGGTGTGFVLESIQALHKTKGETLILTAFHVVACAQRIRVTFSGTVSDAKLVGGNVDMDIAVLVAVRDPTTSLREGDSDRLSKNDSVTAYGFPLGAPQLQTTKGIISARIAGPSRLQADVLVNPGNSGGPLLDDAKQTVVGVITSGVDHQVAVGISYAAPIREAMLAVRRILDAWDGSVAVQDRLPVLGMSFTKINAVLMRQASCEGGVLATSVHPRLQFPQTAQKARDNLAAAAPPASTTQIDAICREAAHMPRVAAVAYWTDVIRRACPALQPEEQRALLLALRNPTVCKGDIIKSVNGRPLDILGHTQFDFWKGGRVEFDAEFDRMNVGQKVQLEVHRRGATPSERAVELDLLPPDLAKTYRHMHFDSDDVAYAVLSGIFVMPLHANHVNEFGNNASMALRAQAIALGKIMQRPDNCYDSLLIITHVMPESPFNSFEHSFVIGDILVAINDRVVRTLDDLMDAWHAARREDVVSLETRTGSVSSATAAQVTECEQSIHATRGGAYVGLNRTRLGAPESPAPPAAPLPAAPATAPATAPPPAPPPAAAAAAVTAAAGSYDFVIEPSDSRQPSVILKGSDDDDASDDDASDSDTPSDDDVSEDSDSSSEQ